MKLSLSRMILVAVVMLAALVVPRSAAAQTAPAGNAHPEQQMLSGGGGANPFGEIQKSTMSVAQKAAFAKAVDLAPLRDLAVLHDGRVKILDSLARETVATICDRKDYIDFEPTDGGGYRKVKQDPLFTLLDIVIDPAYYLDKPLIGINYLPLREMFIEQTVQGADARERWKRLGRLTPEMIEQAAPAILSGGKLDLQIDRAVNKLSQAMELYRGSDANLDMVAADAPDKPWLNIAELPTDNPIRKAAAELGAAWRKGDAPGVNAAAKVLAAELPKINSAQYPQGRRTLERVYNASKPFEWGFWLYAGALISLLLAFGTQRPWLKWLGIAFLAGAVGMHGFGFATRCIVAERFAIQNQFESMTGVSLFAAIVGLTLAISKRQLLFAAAVAAVGFMILITATQTGIPGSSINREAAILNTSVLLKYHVTIVLLSYGLISLGMITSVFYLVTYYISRSRANSNGPAALPSAGTIEVSAAALGIDGAPAGGTARVLHDLDKAQMTILQLAFWALGVGILLGAWWADHSWGRWWAFDPKELWALLTWVVYLVVVHVRKADVKNKALLTAWLSLLGFIVMLWCYFGVNLLLPGLHAYA